MPYPIFVRSYATLLVTTDYCCNYLVSFFVEDNANLILANNFKFPKIVYGANTTLTYSCCPNHYSCPAGIQFTQGTTSFVAQTQNNNTKCNKPVPSDTTWLCPGYHSDLGNKSTVVLTAGALIGASGYFNGDVYLRNEAGGAFFAYNNVFFELVANSASYLTRLGFGYRCNSLNFPPHNCANLAPAPCDTIPNNCTATASLSAPMFLDSTCYADQNYTTVQFTATGTFNANNVFAVRWEDSSGTHYYTGWTQGQAGLITLKNVWIPHSPSGFFSVSIFSSYPVMLGPKLNTVQTSPFSDPLTTLSKYYIPSGGNFTFTTNSAYSWDFGPYASPQTYTGPGSAVVTITLPPSELLYTLQISAKNTGAIVSVYVFRFPFFVLHFLTCDQGCVKSVNGPTLRVGSCTLEIPSNSIVVNSTLTFKFDPGVPVVVAANASVSISTSYSWTSPIFVRDSGSLTIDSCMSNASIFAMGNAIVKNNYCCSTKPVAIIPSSRAAISCTTSVFCPVLLFGTATQRYSVNVSKSCQAPTNAQWLCPGQHKALHYDTVIASAGAVVEANGANNVFLRQGSSSYFTVFDRMSFESVVSIDYYDYEWATRVLCNAIVVPAHNCAMLPAAPCDVPGACSSGVSISAPSIIGTICSSTVSVQFNASGIAAGNMYAVQWSSGSYFTYTGHQYAGNGNIVLANVSVPIGYATMSIAIFASNPTTIGPSSNVAIFAGLSHRICSFDCLQEASRAA